MGDDDESGGTLYWRSRSLWSSRGSIRPGGLPERLIRREIDKKLNKRNKRNSSNVLFSLNDRELGFIKVQGVADTLSRTAEVKLLKKDLQEQSCHVPSNSRSTFLMSHSNCGRYVASSHGDHNIHILDSNSGKLLHSLKGHSRSAWSLAFHPTCNNLLASGCLQGEVRVWDIGGGSETWTAKTAIASLSFHPVDHILAIATFNQIHFWNWNYSQPSLTVSTKSERERVRYVSFDSTGKKLITGISNPPPSAEPCFRSTRSSTDNLNSIFSPNREREEREGTAQDSVMNSLRTLRSSYTAARNEISIQTEHREESNNQSVRGLSTRYHQLLEQYQQLLDRYNRLLDNRNVTSTVSVADSTSQVSDVNGNDQVVIVYQDGEVHTNTETQTVDAEVPITRQETSFRNWNMIPLDPNPGSSELENQATEARRGLRLLSMHIENMERICRARLELSLQNHQISQLNEIRVMLEDLHRQIRAIRSLLRTIISGIGVEMQLGNRTGSESTTNSGGNLFSINERDESHLDEQPPVGRRSNFHGPMSNLSNISRRIRNSNLTSRAEQWDHIRRMNATLFRPISRNPRVSTRSAQSSTTTSDRQDIEIVDLDGEESSPERSEVTILFDSNRSPGDGPSTSASSSSALPNPVQTSPVRSLMNRRLSLMNLERYKLQRLDSRLSRIRNRNMSARSVRQQKLARFCMFSRESRRNRMSRHHPYDQRYFDPLPSTPSTSTSSSVSSANQSLNALMRRLEMEIRMSRQLESDSNSNNMDSSNSEASTSGERPTESNPLLGDDDSLTEGNDSTSPTDSEENSRVDCEVLSSMIDNLTWFFQQQGLSSDPLPTTDQHLSRMWSLLRLALTLARRLLIRFSQSQLSTTQAPPTPATSSSATPSPVTPSTDTPQPDPPAVTSTSGVEPEEPALAPLVGSRITHSDILSQYRNGDYFRRRFRMIDYLERQRLNLHRMEQRQNIVNRLRFLRGTMPASSTETSRSSSRTPSSHVPIPPIRVIPDDTDSGNNVPIIDGFATASAATGAASHDRRSITSAQDRVSPPSLSSASLLLNVRPPLERQPRRIDLWDSQPGPSGSSAADNLNNSIHFRRYLLNRSGTEERTERENLLTPNYVGLNPISDQFSTYVQQQHSFNNANESLIIGSSLSLSHRVQCWSVDNEANIVPDIGDAKKNLVVDECKIQNDSSLSVSKDGSLLAVLLSGQLTSPNTIGIYSIDWPTLGQCMYSLNLEHSAVSVAFSPTSAHIVIGFATRRSWMIHSMNQREKQTIAQVFHLTKPNRNPTMDEETPPIKGRLHLMKEIEVPSRGLNYSLNCIKWCPIPGQGFIYGTSNGLLTMLR